MADLPWMASLIVTVESTSLPSTESTSPWLSTTKGTLFVELIYIYPEEIHGGAKLCQREPHKRKTPLLRSDRILSDSNNRDSPETGEMKSGWSGRSVFSTERT